MTGVISGKALYVSINGIVINGPAAWDAVIEADKLDGTTGLDGGFRSTKTGVVGVGGSMRFKVNILTGLVVNPGSVNNLRLFYAVGDPAPAIDCPVASIFNVRKSGEVRGMFEVTVDFEGDGTFSQNG